LETWEIRSCRPERSEGPRARPEGVHRNRREIPRSLGMTRGRLDLNF